MTITISSLSVILLSRAQRRTEQGDILILSIDDLMKTTTDAEIAGICANIEFHPEVGAA